MTAIALPQRRRRITIAALQTELAELRQRRDELAQSPHLTHCHLDRYRGNYYRLRATGKHELRFGKGRRTIYIPFNEVERVQQAIDRGRAITRLDARIRVLERGIQCRTAKSVAKSRKRTGSRVISVTTQIRAMTESERLASFRSIDTRLREAQSEPKT